jgi:DNA processing protein
MRLLRANPGASALREMVERHGSAAAAIDRPDPEWRAAGADANALAVLRANDRTIAETDDSWLAATDHHLIGWEDPDYPTLLRRIQSPPPALFVAGDPNLLWNPQIAIVGSRNATAGGIDNARGFARAPRLT